MSFPISVVHACLLACALLSACAPPQPAESERASHFQERLYHVYVISNYRHAMGGAWADAFHGRLARAFDAERVTHALEHVTLSPEGDIEFATVREHEKMQERLEEFDPEVVLVLLGRRGVIEQTQAGPVSRDVIGALLFTPDDDELVWALSHAFAPGRAGPVAATDVLRRMKADGLVRGATIPAAEGTP